MSGADQIVNAPEIWEYLTDTSFDAGIDAVTLDGITTYVFRERDHAQMMVIPRLCKFAIDVVEKALTAKYSSFIWHSARALESLQNFYLSFDQGIRRSYHIRVVNIKLIQFAFHSPLLHNLSDTIYAFTRRSLASNFI